MGDNGLEPKVLPNGKTLLRNKCGHDFEYNIKKASAVQWLQGRPCPSCARKNPNQKQDKPKLQDIHDNYQDKAPEPMPEKAPEPIPEPFDEEALQRILSEMPEVPDSLHHNVFVDVVLMSNAGLPIWMQGPPGTSKSTLAEQVSTALGLPFHYIQCHEMMTDSSLFGYRDATGVMHRTPFREAFEHGGVFLLDEVDNGNPNLLAALNSALANGHAVFADEPVLRHKDFRVIATANTAGLGPEAGFIGRNGVDAATRDRFVTVHVPIDTKLEAALAYLAAGEHDEVAKFQSDCVATSVKKREERARNIVQKPSVATIIKTVVTVRQIVENRFRGTVVSPRVLMQASSLVSAGFTLQEAIASKLPGMTPSEAITLVKEAN